MTTSNLDSVLSSKGGTSESIVNSTSSPLITQFGKAVQNVTESLSYDQAYINALNAMGNKLYMATGKLTLENLSQDEMNSLNIISQYHHGFSLTIRLKRLIRT